MITYEAPGSPCLCASFHFVLRKPQWAASSLSIFASRELRHREVLYVAGGYTAAVWKAQYLIADVVMGLIVMLHSATNS